SRRVDPVVAAVRLEEGTASAAPEIRIEEFRVAVAVEDVRLEVTAEAREAGPARIEVRLEVDVEARGHEVEGVVRGIDGPRGGGDGTGKQGRILRDGDAVIDVALLIVGVLFVRQLDCRFLTNEALNVVVRRLRAGRDRYRGKSDAREKPPSNPDTCT